MTQSPTEEEGGGTPQGEHAEGEGEIPGEAVGIHFQEGDTQGASHAGDRQLDFNLPPCRGAK